MPERVTRRLPGHRLAGARQFGHVLELRSQEALARGLNRNIRSRPGEQHGLRRDFAYGWSAPSAIPASTTM